MSKLHASGGEAAAAPGTRGLQRKPDPDALGLGVQLQGVMAQFAAEARFLVTAKRRAGVEGVVGVDPHRPGLERAMMLSGREPSIESMMPLTSAKEGSPGVSGLSKKVVLHSRR